MLAHKVFFADAFFGTMTAGTTSVETIRSFLAATRDFQLAEIGLHPGGSHRGGQLAGRCLARSAGTRCGREELKMLVSVDLEELLLASGCRLGRLGRAGVG